MFSRILTQTSMMTYSEQIEQVRQALHEADAVVIGAGSGLSTSAGLTYSGPRFQEHFGDFIQKYKIQDMYSGGFYPFDTLEEHWAWWSRHILITLFLPPMWTINSSWPALIRSGCSIPRETTVYGNARSHAVKRPGTTRKPSGAWWQSSGICVSPRNLSRIARSAAGP